MFNKYAAFAKIEVRITVQKTFTYHVCEFSIVGNDFTIFNCELYQRYDIS